MRRHSPIWTMPPDEFRALVAQSNSVSDILRHVGLRTEGGNFKTVKARLQAEGIDTRHMTTRRKQVVGAALQRQWTPLDVILVENSTYTSRRSIKARLLREGLLTNECAECGLPPEWQGKPLVLILDHINGVHNDHRIENLRLVCPNCAAQLPTHAGRNTMGRSSTAEPPTLNRDVEGSSPSAPA